MWRLGSGAPLGPAERNALLEISKARSAWGGYTEEELQADCVDIAYIECDDTGAVTAITLTSYDVIPDAIQALSRLQYLNWAHSSATQVPTVIGTLTSLTKIDMLRSLASGSLPSSFSVLSNLKQLYIEDGLSGSLPAAVGRMTSLESLQINGCPLGGSLPSEMKFLAKLLTLEITSSNITGSLDPIQPLTQLQRIQIRRGRLLGSIPSGFSRFSNLNQLVLDDNALSGTVPGKWAGLTSLSILR
ncbi:hypothetical protein CLOM_g11141 [Closterium sp. NIES-68]|nr:hypothetical protein CLOM_g11141 [Closterium sp. NIES-68]